MKIEGRDEEEASIIGEDEDDSIYHDDHGGGGGGEEYPIPAPVAHLGGGGGGGGGVGGVNKFSPFNAYQSYHQSEMNSEDQTNRIAMAQQFSYDEVKAKDSTGFKIIASIVYAKAKELAADCPIADYKVKIELMIMNDESRFTVYTVSRAGSGNSGCIGTQYMHLKRKAHLNAVSRFTPGVPSQPCRR